MNFWFLHFKTSKLLDYFSSAWRTQLYCNSSHSTKMQYEPDIQTGSFCGLIRMPDSQRFCAHWLNNWLRLCYKWVRLYIIYTDIFQTAHDVFYLRKFSVLITSQLGFQLLTKVTSVFWNYLKSLLHSESIFFYYHGEIQAYEHIILRIIRESLHNNTIIALKQAREKKIISAQCFLLLSK